MAKMVEWFSSCDKIH